MAGRRSGAKRNVKKGVQFTLMVVGQSLITANFLTCWMNTVPGASGTGRTTFVNTLCESEVLGHKVADNAETAHVEEGIRIKPVNVGQFEFWLLFRIVPSKHTCYCRT